MKPSERITQAYERGTELDGEFTLVGIGHSVIGLASAVTEIRNILDEQHEKIKELQENNKCRCETCVADRT